jgi:hypothetical protein
MGTLEDQLKQWQKQSAKTAAAAAAPSSPPPSRRAQKKKPLLQTIRRDEPTTTSTTAPPPPKPLSDAELFSAAVEGVSADAVLDKFSSAPTVKVRGQTLQPSAPKSDGELFSEFVGSVQQKGEPTPPKSPPTKSPSSSKKR